jgi:hypothetical protein
MHLSYFADGSKRLNDEEIRNIKESETKIKRTFEKTHPSPPPPSSKEIRAVFATGYSSAKCALGHLISEFSYFRCSVISQT